MQHIDVDTDRTRTSVWTGGPKDRVPVLLIHVAEVAARHAAS